MAREDDDDTSVESSLDELLQKKATPAPLDEPDDDDILELDADLPDDPSVIDPLTVKALPQQANEFRCASCFLVKHRSQLADAKRSVCRDCA